MPKTHSDPFLRKLGARIQELRLERQITQEELAHRCKIDRSYMSGIERGVRNITVLQLVKLANEIAHESANATPKQAEDALDFVRKVLGRISGDTEY